VAIKVIEVGEKESEIRKIEREIDMMKSCSHPNIVKYYDSFLANHRFHVSPLPFKREGNWPHVQIVMEYCGGGAVSDLYEILDKPLTEPQIAFICQETLKVLQ
jgi:serine/threonine protein kinase